MRCAEDKEHRGDSNSPSFFDLHGIVLQRCEKRGCVFTTPQRLLVLSGRSVCDTLATRQRTYQALSSVRRDTLLHASIA